MPFVPASSAWRRVQILRRAQSAAQGPENVETGGYGLFRFSCRDGTQGSKVQCPAFRFSAEGTDIQAFGESLFEGEQKVALSGAPLSHHHNAAGGRGRYQRKDQVQKLRSIREF
ncbi:hypothetical protein AAU01_22700 [Paenarthrobacter aurescens]|uniref:Uncharacterized protein n=1 Tax=Paenarthrobacter aurescens TaxID=43663 RepID=A0A4Y3NGB5_PAEAU|nr:hypothetical protein AAU01_22700 [Paenarthrobacter aurescens]